MPRTSLELRQRLVEDLRVDPIDLPFAGELIQVREDAAEWEGAAERVLHTFALSLLVPDRHYDAVATWINEHHLNARLVYFRVPARLGPAPPPERRSTHPLLVDVLEVKPDSRFEPWLESELARRANHACVDSVGDFRTTQKAVTRAGQIKDRERHEKDDRKRIDDRREYVLGWTNEAKIDALMAHATALHGQQSSLSGIIDSLKKQEGASSSQLQSLAKLGEYTSWDELDWQGLVSEVAALGSERDRITSSSDTLAQLTAERDGVRQDVKAREGALSGLQRERGGVESRQRTAEAGLARVGQVLSDRESAAAAESFGSIDLLVAPELGEGAPDAGTLAAIEQQVRTTLDSQLNGIARQQNTVGLRIVRSMGAFRGRYPNETAEFDDSLGSAGDYRQLHQRVATDDLPRFESEFKDYLNQNTIRDIAGFSAQLNKHEKLIRDRIETINGSLPASTTTRTATSGSCRPDPEHRRAGVPCRPPGLHRQRRRRNGDGPVLGGEVPTGQAGHRSVQGPRRALPIRIATGPAG